MGRVLDHREPVSPGEGVDRLYVARATGEVHRHYYPRQATRCLRGGQRVRQCGHAHVAGIGLDIDEVDRGPAIEPGIG